MGAKNSLAQKRGVECVLECVWKWQVGTEISGLCWPASITQITNPNFIENTSVNGGDDDGVEKLLKSTQNNDLCPDMLSHK